MFVARVIDKSIGAPESFLSISRRMRPESAKLMLGENDVLMGMIYKLASLDRLTSTNADLFAYKWTIVADTASFRSLMDIGLHAQKQTL